MSKVEDDGLRVEILEISVSGRGRADDGAGHRE